MIFCPVCHFVCIEMRELVMGDIGEMYKEVVGWECPTCESFHVEEEYERNN